MFGINGFLAWNTDSRHKTFFNVILLLLISSVAGTSTIGLSPAQQIAKSSCTNTLYPDLCYSSVLESLSENQKEVNTKDVIVSSLKTTIVASHRNYDAIKKVLTENEHGKGNLTLTEREKGALRDCLLTNELTLDELNTAVEDLTVYPFKKAVKDHADDLKTFLSSAITNQETCMDGFSYGKVEKRAGDVLVGGQVLRVEKLCSNSLAMLTNMTNADIVNEENLSRGRKLLTPASKWPKWMSAGDRRLLQSTSVTADVVVAADGSGNYRTVQAAVEAAPSRSSRRYVIRIRAGVYRENVDVPRSKTNIMFVGDGIGRTIITGSRSVRQGSTTFNSATVAVVGERFLARDITFQNTAGPSNHQAVALRVGSDLSAFYRCEMQAYQDTLYVHSNRQFYVECLISGTVDFIFGNAAAVLQNCDIRARRPNSGQRNMVTAQGRSDPNQNTGIVLQRCRIAADSDLVGSESSFPTFLGRPWREYSRTVVMQSSITNVINPAGWHEWSGNFALDTLFYGEYQNTGAGADTSRRVRWKGYRVITSSSEAAAYAPNAFIAGNSWLGSTSFPFSPGL